MRVERQARERSGKQITLLEQWVYKHRRWML